MNRKIIFVILAVIIIAAGILIVSSQHNNVENHNNTTVNNTTDIRNWTLSNESEKSPSASQSSGSQAKSSSDPAYNSEDYVKRWDQSQNDGDSWAYTHSQPTKTDDDGHRYKRMYNPETGESYWGFMD